MKIFVSFLLVLSGYYSARAQLVIDTIYTNKESDIALTFFNKVEGRSFNPDNAPYAIKSIPSNNKGFTVTATENNSSPGHLYVSVKGMYLHFLVLFKKKPDYFKVYDYSKDKINDLFEQAKANEQRAIVENSAVFYKSLLDNGEQKLKEKKYKEAQQDFEKAHSKRPEETYPVTKLEEIKKILDEEAKKEQAKQQGFYKSYMADGEAKLKKNQLTAARIAFGQALIINPNDPVATNRIALIDEKEHVTKANEEIKNNYAQLVKTADKAFADGDYTNAEITYTKAKAITSIKSTWPQEQINKIHKILADNDKKIADAKKASDEKVLLDKRQKENEKLENDFNAAIQSADKLFAQDKLDKAREGYLSALQIIKNRPWPKEQIAKIDIMLKERDLKEKTEREKEAIRLEKEKREKEALALENKYNEAIKTADDFFNAKNYTAARPAYVHALSIIKKPYAETQLKKTDQIIADIAAAEQAEKLRIEKEKLITARYTKALDAANAALAKNSYDEAKKLYLQASSIKPDESLPKQKITEIQNIQDAIAAKEKAERERKAAEATQKKKYDLAMAKAKSYYVKEDLVNALAAYNEARDIKPLEQEPQVQAKIIQEKLDEIARIKARDELYDAKIALADSLLIKRNYEASMLAYHQADSINPSERYPKSQMKYVQTEIENDRIAAIEQEKQEAQRKVIERENKIRRFNHLGDSAVAEKNWDYAEKQYAEVLRIDSHNDRAKQMQKIVLNQKDKAIKAAQEPVAKNVESQKPAVEPPKTIDSAASEITSLPLQVKSPYTDEELKQKFPGIDFTKLPPEQPLADSFTDTKENAAVFYKILTSKPRLDISDKEHKVKLICQSMNFETIDGDENVYIKLLIQNESQKDFLTGAMMLTWLRKTGTQIRMYPLYIYPAFLPIIPPGKESVVIYVCKSYDIPDNEKLEFKLSDRMNKINLELNFSGAVFYEESTH